jgi:SpoVK/Ycf46/Vps4 family AAA+-type ATPase
MMHTSKIFYIFLSLPYIMTEAIQGEVQTEDIGFNLAKIPWNAMTRLSLSMFDLIRHPNRHASTDFEVLMCEAKLVAMREFMKRTEGRSVEEINEAVANLKVSKAHFDEAFVRMRTSTNKEEREMYKRQA